MKKGNQMYYGNAKTRNAFNIYRVWCENRGSGVGVDLTLASFLQGRMMRVREAYNQHGESQAQEVAIKRCGNTVTIVVDDRCDWNGEVKTDDEGNRFRKVSYEVKISGSSWGNSVSNAVVLAELIREASVVASTLEMIVKSNVVYDCFQTKEEHEEFQTKREARKNDGLAEIVVGECSARLRVGKERTINFDDIDILCQAPATGEYTVRENGKSFTLIVTDNLGTITRTK
jgi:hypothetical protein